MQAITTKYLPATETLGPRIKATAQAGSVTIAWDDDISGENNHGSAMETMPIEHALCVCQRGVWCQNHFWRRCDVADDNVVEQVDRIGCSARNSESGQYHRVGALGVEPLGESHGQEGRQHERKHEAIVAGRFEHDEDG